MTFLSHSEHSIPLQFMNWQIMFKGPTCILGYYKFDQSFPKIYDSKTLTVCASLDEVIEISEGALAVKAQTNHENRFRKMQ